MFRCRCEDPRSAIKTLKHTAALLHDGRSTLVFPEGGRSETGELQEFKDGAAFLAIRAQIPVVPMAMIGMRSILPMHTLTFHRGPVTLRIGEPISTDGHDHAPARRAHRHGAPENRRDAEVGQSPGLQRTSVSDASAEPGGWTLSYSSFQKRISTSAGYRSPVPTKIDRISQASSGADVSNFGTVRKYTSDGSTGWPGHQPRGDFGRRVTDARRSAHR